jgi:hypothetical protein
VKRVSGAHATGHDVQHVRGGIGGPALATAAVATR